MVNAGARFSFRVRARIMVNASLVLGLGFG